MATGFSREAESGFAHRRPHRVKAYPVIALTMLVPNAAENSRTEPPNNTDPANRHNWVLPSLLASCPASRLNHKTTLLGKPF